MRKRYYWDKEAREWVEKRPVDRSKRVEVLDREKVMGDGIVSQADGKVYTSRAAYEDSLKRHGMFVVGNDVIERKPVEPSSAVPLIEKFLSQQS